MIKAGEYTPPAGSGEKDGHQRYRILAVDHEKSMLTLYRDVMLLEGADPSDLEALLKAPPEKLEEAYQKPVFDITLCSTGDEALKQVRRALEESNPYSVVLMDTHLGGTEADGMIAAEQIRKMDRDMEIVMVSGSMSVPLAELNSRVPPPEKLLFLQKPFRPQELRQMALSLCSKWSTEKRLRELNENMAILVDERTAELNQANKQLEKDLDERLMMLKEIWASEERYRLLFEEDITGNFVADLEGNILACNESFARLFGYSTMEEARQFNVLHLELESGEMRSLLKAIREHKKIENFEAVFKRKNLDPVHVIGTFVGVFDEDAALKEIRGYFFNITERKELEEQLRLAQKMEALGTLAGGIAHDFNNILGVILGYAEIIMESAEKESGLSRRIREVINAGTRGRDLVKQILNFSRQGSQELKPLTITPLLKEALKLLRSSIPADIAIRQHLLTEEDMVMADPTQIHQILLNLCTNALHAMKETGGELSVALDEVAVDDEGASQHPDLSPGRFVRLTVSDTGHGMDKDVIRRMFDPFFTTKKPGEGTGMGLAVVHGIVKRHHGAIIVQSEPGHGATFHVYIPKAQSLAGYMQVVEETDYQGAGRVLMVDDEKPLADIGEEMLRSMGFTPVVRTSSVEALEAFKNSPDDFVLVITDQSMPNMTGTDLSKRLLQIRPDIPIILCTGFSEAVSYDVARRMGIRDFVMKPILRNQLAERIKRVLEAAS